MPWLLAFTVMDQIEILPNSERESSRVVSWLLPHTPLIWLLPFTASMSMISSHQVLILAGYRQCGNRIFNYVKHQWNFFQRISFYMQVFVSACHSFWAKMFDNLHCYANFSAGLKLSRMQNVQASSLVEKHSGKWKKSMKFDIEEGIWGTVGIIEAVTVQHHQNDSWILDVANWWNTVP